MFRTLVCANEFGRISRAVCAIVITNETRQEVEKGPHHVDTKMERLTLSYKKKHLRQSLRGTAYVFKPGTLVPVCGDRSMVIHRRKHLKS